MPACEPQDVRDYLLVTGDANAGQYSDELLDGFIESAFNYLQTATGRQFTDQAAVTKVVSTEGSLYVTIPDCRLLDEVRLEGAVIVEGTDYEPVADRHDPDMTIGLRLKPRSSTAWNRGINDLEVDGDFGYEIAPAELVVANKVLAGWYAKRPDAVFGSTVQTGEGNVIDISRLPYEVWQFMKSWDLSPVLVK